MDKNLDANITVLTNQFWRIIKKSRTSATTVSNLWTLKPHSGMKEGIIATRAKMCCHRSIISIFGQLSKADALQLFFSTISPRSQGNIGEFFLGRIRMISKSLWPLASFQGLGRGASRDCSRSGAFALVIALGHLCPLTGHLMAPS